MLKQLTAVNVWVHDQEEALAFYTEKLGLELRDDVTVPEMSLLPKQTVDKGMFSFAVDGYIPIIPATK